MARYTGYDNWAAEQQNDSYQNEISHTAVFCYPTIYKKLLNSDLYKQAEQIKKNEGKCSAIYFQMRFKIGFLKAAILVEMLELLDKQNPQQ